MTGIAVHVRFFRNAKFKKQSCFVMGDFEFCMSSVQIIQQACPEAFALLNENTINLLKHQFGTLIGTIMNQLEKIDVKTKALRKEQTRPSKRKSDMLNSPLKDAKRRMITADQKPLFIDIGAALFSACSGTPEQKKAQVIDFLQVAYDGSLWEQIEDLVLLRNRWDPIEIARIIDTGGCGY